MTEVAVRVVVLSLLITVLAGCALQPPAGPAPQPPTELLQLPRTERVVCYDDPRFLVSVWELPGVEPDDLDSAYQGNHGEMIAQIDNCSEVAVLGYTWSEWDQQYWVLVQQGETKGWLDLVRLQEFRGWEPGESVAPR